MLLQKPWRLTLVEKSPGYGQPHVRPFPTLALREPMPVHLALIEHGVITRPTSSPTAEAGCFWVAESTWAYTTEFTTPPTSEPLLLTIPAMEGVMEIKIGEETVGTHDNAFLPARVLLDLPPETTHTLTLVFHNAIAEGQKRRQAYFDAEGLPWNTSFLDERAFLRRPDYNYAWDWGPRIIGVGLMSEPTIIPVSQSKPEITVQSTWLSDANYQVTVIVTDPSGKEHDLVYSPPASVASFDIKPQGVNHWEISISGGEWNPRGFGEPTMHSLHLSANPDEPTSFGLRRVELVREPDAYGESFAFRINGKDIWCRGANWIPENVLDPRVNRDSLASKLSTLAQANFNMLRVWGGGTYESEAFYDLCDRLGIMVWQDFPFACSYYPDDLSAQDELRAEATAQVARIRKHPSLALWCGNNENEVMYVQQWSQNGPVPPRYYGEVLYYDVLPSVVKAHDPETPYIAGSPIGSPPGKVDPNADGYGDQHYWEVWHGQGDWVHYANSKARFSSEFGFASAAPSLRFFETGDPWESASWHRFDRTGKARTRIRELVELHYPVAIDSHHWQLITQLNQRDAMRCALEHYRTSEFCRGALIWQANDCWPAFSWSLLDFHGAGKAALFEMRRAFADLLLAVWFEPDTGEFRITAVNHGVSAAEATIRYNLIDATTGAAVTQGSGTPLLAPDAIVSVPAIPLPNPGPHLIMVEIDGMPDTRTWRLNIEPKDLRSPPPEVTIELSKRQITVNGLLWDVVPVASRGNIVSFEPLTVWNETVPFPRDWPDLVSSLLGPLGPIPCTIRP